MHLVLFGNLLSHFKILSDIFLFPLILKRVEVQIVDDEQTIILSCPFTT